MVSFSFSFALTPYLCDQPFGDHECDTDRGGYDSHACDGEQCVNHVHNLPYVVNETIAPHDESPDGMIGQRVPLRSLFIQVVSTELTESMSHVLELSPLAIQIDV
jgi:hypothetical protein